MLIKKKNNDNNNKNKNVDLNSFKNSRVTGSVVK